MDIMRSFNVKVPNYIACSTPAEAEEAFKKLGGNEGKDVVLKAQALTGGRGLGHFKNGFHGGVHMITKAGEATEIASKMLGGTLITKQTGEKGIPVHKVMVMERIYMRREMYFSILMDRKAQGPVMVASPSGGTSIEDVAEASPELIFTENIDPMKGPSDEQLEKLSKSLGIAPASIEKGKEMLGNLYKMFMGTDATLVEINPLAETPEGEGKKSSLSLSMYVKY